MSIMDMVSRAVLSRQKSLGLTDFAVNHLSSAINEEVAFPAQERIAELASIVGDLSEIDPEDRDGDNTCMFCYGRVPWAKRSTHTIHSDEFHDRDCVWLRANQAIQKQLEGKK